MATYKYTILTKDVQHNIQNGLYSQQEMDEIYGGLKEKAEAGKKKMKIVGIIIILVYVVAILPSIKSVFDMGDFSIVWAVMGALVPLPFFALGYALARWHTYGMFCSQFHKALKQGYPQYTEKYRL